MKPVNNYKKCFCCGMKYDIRAERKKMYLWLASVHCWNSLPTKNKSPIGAAIPKGPNKHNPIHANVRAT